MLQDLLAPLERSGFDRSALEGYRMDLTGREVKDLRTNLTDGARHCAPIVDRDPGDESEGVI